MTAEQDRTLAIIFTTSRRVRVYRGSRVRLVADATEALRVWQPGASHVAWVERNYQDGWKVVRWCTDGLGWIGAEPCEVQ